MTALQFVFTFAFIGYTIFGIALPVALLDTSVDWDLIFAWGIGPCALGGFAALGMFLKRWDDRTTLENLLRAGAPGTENAAVEIGWEKGVREKGRSVVKTAVAGDVKWTTVDVYDLKQSAGFRLFKRLGLSRRLAIDNEAFNDEIYVGGNAKVGATLLASARRREAARAIFRLGFFRIEYRNGLLMADRREEVTDDVAAAVRPHLLVLAGGTGQVSHKP